MKWMMGLTFHELRLRQLRRKRRLLREKFQKAHEHNMWCWARDAEHNRLYAAKSGFFEGIAEDMAQQTTSAPQAI